MVSLALRDFLFEDCSLSELILVMRVLRIKAGLMGDSWAHQEVGLAWEMA